MDSNIRKLIHAASQDDDLSALTEAYGKLRKERQSSDDKIDAVSSDLFVLCAETALKHGQLEVMEDCIKMFFHKTPPSNQFLCRAYLCQAQLNAPTSSKNPEQLDKAVEYLLKAINFAKKNPRYYFLVYNASVLYWQFCRPFLKPNYRQYLAKSLHQVVKALDDIDDKDYGWRAQLMIALIECHVDAGRKEDATQISIATLAFTKSNVPSLYTTVLGLQVRHRLIDLSKASKEARASNELYIFYKIQRLRTLIEADEKVDVDLELNKIYKSIVKGVDATDRASTAMSTSTSTSKASSPYVVGSNDRIPLLIELGRLCLEYNKHELAADCLENLKGGVKNSDTLLEIEFMKCELMVKSLGEKKENYSKSVVERRIQAIRKLEQYIMTAIRMGNPNVIQAGCVTMWNLCLPLLQANLRHHVRKPLTLAAQALEDIDSLLVLLRCQMHTELAKCEEAEDQLEYAVTHLRKALEMDDSGQYYDRLQTALTRLQLRATLYKTPERPEDLAAMIIEQARASDDASTVRMKRASLVRAGEALSPDAFMLVLDSESDTKDPSTTKGPPTALGRLAGRAKQFEKGVGKAAGHLKRLGDENDQERVRIWADLAKTARKQQVWDVARVAARFCLLYDDNRWSKKSSGSTSEKNGDGVVDREESSGTKSPVPGETGNKLDVTGMKLLYPEGMTPFSVEQDLLRTLAEVHFIFAEALVHLLKIEGVQLCDKPVPPEDTIKLRPKRYGDQLVNFDEIPEWVSYCEWISSLSNDVIHSFQRAAEIGVELKEPWLVCNAAVYLWNYTTHLLSQGRNKEVIPTYSPVLEAMKVTGHAGETVLLCQMCNAIAQGFMQPWIPALPPPTAPATPSKDKSDKPDKAKGRQSGKGGTKGGPSKGSLQTVAVDPEATPDLKQALEVLEYALNTTNGQETKNLVPVSTRHPLIISWVFCKQLLNQQIPKNLGHDDEDPHSQGPMCRALCAVEMLSLQNNGLPEFTGTCPSLAETVKLVDACQWSDSLVELQMWSRLSVLAFNAENHSLVLHCGQKAVAFAENDKCLAKRNPKKPDRLFQHKLVVEQEMLYYSSVVMGQSLMKNMQGKNEIRRDALVCFVNACRFGQKAGNYELVIAAARHYWNAIKPFIVEPIERELLREPMEAVLECIAAVAANEVGKEDEDDDEDTESSPEKKPSKKPISSKSDRDKKAKEKGGDKKKEKEKEKEKGKTGKGGKTDKQDSKESKSTDDKGKTGKAAAEQEEKPPPLPSAYDEDLKLRAAMYGVLFQAYADKGEWEQGLRAMDQAVKDMPRTYHRLLIFKHRVITKAKLGRNVMFDMGKFKNETEDVIAAMWRHVALNSKASQDQLSAYQNAIEALESPESDWQKVDYLMEFGEWLFVNEYPVADALDQFLWAADILLNKNPNRGDGQDDHDDERSENDSEIDAARYIPGERQSLIGVRPSDVAVKLEDITDIRQLETLMRIHIMLAQVAGYSSPHSRDYVLIAYSFLHRIWQVSISSAERMLKEGGKPGERAPSKKGKEKGKEAKESQTKVDRSGGKTILPNSMEGWATFELSEKLQEYFKCDITGTMINKATFQKPMLTMHYIQALLRDLRDLGYHQLALPVVAMQQLIADLIIDDAQLKKLVHLRAMELCQEVNLLSGVSHHEKCAGRMLLTEQEQAKSREEIEMWKEKQRQVKTEEEKTKNSKSVIFDTTTANLVLRPQAPDGENVTEDESWNKHKQQISSVCYRELWTEQAEILIRQGQFLPARQLLSEANLSARAFDDKRTLSNILLQLAVMALAESNWGQATSLLLEAQKLHGDQQFWLRTTLLLCEASFSKIDKNSTLLNSPDPAAKEKACDVLLRSKHVFQDLASENPNKANMADYIEAIIEARLGTLFGHMVNDKHLRKEEQARKDLIKACKHLSRAAANLSALGHRREAIKIMLKLSEIKRAFAEDKEKQDFLLEAFDFLKQAVSLSDAVLHDVLSVCTLSELGNLSLPVQREAVETKLVLSDLMVDMLKQVSTEDRGKRELETQKGSIQKMIDDYVGVESLPTEKEQKWRAVTGTLAEDTLMQLSVAHGLTGNVGFLKAKTFYILGCCLGVLAAHTAPDPDSQWKEIEVVPPQELEADRTAPPQDPPAAEPGPENQDSADPETEATQNPSREFLKFTSQALELKAEFTTSERYLSQAVECLTQCIQIGLKHGFRDVVCKAAHELMESIGAHDPLTSSQYLALYQSCQMSQVLEGVLRRVQLDPSVSRQAALLHQRKLLTDMEFLNDASSSVLASNSNHLADCEAWRRLTIARNHLELTREFSATNTQFVVLQHSPDRRYLYGAVLDKGRSPVPSGKANKQASTLPVPAKPLITRAAVSARELEQLIEEFSVFKSDTASELMRRNYVRHQQEQKRKMLAKLEDGLQADSKELLNVDSSFAEKEAQLESHFKDVVAAVEAYLDPILTKLHPALNPESVSESIVLLADEWLLQLPLEAIRVFAVPQITSISRDFSLQFHYHRVHPAERSESAIKIAGKGGKKSDKAKSDKPSTAKSGQKSDKKGKDLGSGVPKEGLVVDFNGIRYIVDPYNECSEEGDDNPSKVMNDAISKFKNFTAKWSGIIGSDHLPSVGEFQRLVSESTGFIFYGPERFLGCMPPNMLAPMNVTDCHLVILLDLVQTGQSFLRQGKDDATKAVGELWLERPLETAMLLSLVGVAGVVSSQWHCQLADNKHKLDTYLTGLLETSKTVGEAVRALVQFPKPPDEVPEIEAASDRGSKSGNQIDKEATGDEHAEQAEKITEGSGVATEQPSFSRHWFNTVLYGTPILVLNPPKGS
ncbi:unnamed protein product [Porites lobata]|uniref:Cilia- and flagella-associated protein 46 n=1 Tax=Porites lobata TaxID=104759 RepID=A0ABN8Q0I5_9CNID|nr:unnamed protein product [Porites lobata]